MVILPMARRRPVQTAHRRHMQSNKATWSGKSSSNGMVKLNAGIRIEGIYAAR
jgi:hypothetical protein